jgi:hypothetical protein
MEQIMGHSIDDFLTNAGKGPETRFDQSLGRAVQAVGGKQTGASLSMREQWLFTPFVCMEITLTLRWRRQSVMFEAIIS